MQAERQARAQLQRRRRNRPRPVILGGAGPPIIGPIPIADFPPPPPPPPPPPAAGQGGLLPGVMFGPGGPFPGGGGGGGGDDDDGGGGPPLAPAWPEPLDHLMGRAHRRPPGGGGDAARYCRHGRSGSPFSNARSWSRVRPMPMYGHPRGWYAGPGGVSEGMGMPMGMPWTEVLLPRRGRGGNGGGGGVGDDYDVIERGPAFP